VTGFILVLNDWNVCGESLKVSLPALSGGDRFVVAVTL
jgi:hypothetical protein